MRARECKTFVLYLMWLSSLHPPEARTKPHPQPEHLSSMQVPGGAAVTTTAAPAYRAAADQCVSSLLLVAGCPFPSLSAPLFPPVLGSCWGGAYGMSLAIRQEMQEAKRRPKGHPGDTTDGPHRLVWGPEQVESGPPAGCWCIWRGPAVIPLPWN